MKELRAKVHFPRKIRPGIRPRVESGASLNCLVLFAGVDEWIGVDLASGALLRSRQEEASMLRLAHHADRERRVTRFDVVEIVATDDTEPVDPARPEAVAAAGSPTYLGRPSPRRVRALLRELTAPERKGASLLSSWGPSIAYVDLDGSTQSVAIVRTSPSQLTLLRGHDISISAQVTWSGTTQLVPVIDPVAERALGDATDPLTKSALVEALGFRPSYLVCALAAVRDGHAPKVILAVLPRRIPRQQGKRLRRLLRKRSGSEILSHGPAESDDRVTT